MLLTACSQTSEFHRPALPVPEKWPVAAHSNVKPDTAKTHWRIFFADPQLQALIAAALEYNRDNQASTWRNPNTGANVSATPTRAFRSGSGENCREYQTTVTVSGKRENAYGTACRQADGSWKIAN